MSAIRDYLLRPLEKSEASLAKLCGALLAEAAPCHETGPVIRIRDKILLDQILTSFGPEMPSAGDLYEAALHRESGALMVASLPVLMTASTQRYSQSFQLHYQSIAVWLPGLGVEIATVGRIGDIQSKPFVLRSESACTPSFLFGALQCNCASQWRCTQELAAWFNADTRAFSARTGFLMVHLENQNGMGIGYAGDTFTMAPCTRSHLRHAAALALSQQQGLSIQETFAAMALPNDPRRASNGAGYRITPIVMDFLATHSEVILLSNNPQKLAGLHEAGYLPLRLTLQGEITEAGMPEASERQRNLGHFDIGKAASSFDAEFERLKIQIEMTCQERRKHAG